MSEQPTIFEYAWFSLSCVMLIAWLWRNNGGRTAFNAAPLRKHSLGGIDVMVVLFIYISFQMIAAMYNQRHSEGGWGDRNITNLISICGMLVTSGVVVYFGLIRFEGGVSGFGLSAKKPGRILGRVLGYSVVIFGLVFMALMVTLVVSKLCGYMDEQKHLFLEMLRKNPPKLTIAILVVSAVVIAPMVEELIFRGVVQSYLIGLFDQIYPKNQGASEMSHIACWLGIAVTAGFFAMIHADWQHMPALFVLGVALGYVRQRHGCLVIPIMIHSLFNLLPVTLTIIEHVK